MPKRVSETVLLPTSGSSLVAASYTSVIVWYTISRPACTHAKLKYSKICTSGKKWYCGHTTEFILTTPVTGGVAI